MAFKWALGFVLFLFLMTSWTEARDRVYYLAINEIMWDYAPSGLNLMTNNRLKDEPISRIYSDMYIGKVYKKAVYRRYTDDSFETAMPHDPNLGFMGPTLRAEVGDRVIVNLLNNASRPYSVHPHGAFYTKANEGALYADNSTDKGDDGVPANGGRYTYEWEIRPDYGPAKDDSNCLTWAYHSHTDSPRDINSGLIGAFIVCRPGTYADDDTRTDVDHEFVAMIFIPHERESWYFWENLRTIPDWETVDINEKYFEKGNKMHVVNSYMYGNTPGYNVCQGDTISWHVLGMGSDRDLHPIQFQGQTILKQHHRKDSFIVIPATFSTLSMRASNPGRWIIACKLYNHFTEGMTAWLNVDRACRNPSASLPSDSLTGRVREFFIAAEEIMWDYGPTGWNRVDNESLTEPDSDAAVFFEKTPERIGGVYKKAVFRAYTDATFTEPLPRPANIGMLGPVIAGEIGDTIRIVFKNTATNHAYNLEPHGVYFQEYYAVPPQSKHTYTWTLPDDVSPSDRDPPCLTYLYASSVSYILDTNAGLLGPLLVCKRGTLESEMAKEHRYVMMKVFDENKSWYFNDNLNKFTSDPSSVDTGDGDFEESNLMHSINGLQYGNLEIDLCVKQETIFHFFSVGTDVDIHSLSMEGINLEIDGVNTGSVDLFAHTSETVTVRPEHAGRGLILCRTIDHTITGMTGLYSARTCDSGADLADDDVASVTRTYYIAAEEVRWNYNKGGFNVKGKSVNVPGNHGYKYLHHEPGRLIGSVYKKVLYHEYTDDTFTRRKPKPAYLGILGPIIKGEVGDRIHVVFKNMARRAYNIFPWGAIDPTYDLNDNAVQPDQTVEYDWVIPESAGPKVNQPRCQSFIYVSTVDIAIDPTDGLMGPLLVCAKGFVDSHDVDEEFYLQFQIVDENLSHYLDDNIREFLEVDPDSFDKDDDEFVESNQMKAINGFLSHVEGLVMRENDQVRWHLIGWGNEKDYHSVHFHGHTYVHVTDGTYRGDVFELFPGFLGTVTMQTVAVGNWLLHCHVFDHIDGGMETTYTVLERDAPYPVSFDPPTTGFHRDTCEASINGGSDVAYDCSKMNISKVDDLVQNKRYMEVIFANGTLASIKTKDVVKLDLSHNKLTTTETRRILKFFPNLEKIALNDNKLVKIPGKFLAKNPKVSVLMVRNNPTLQQVSRGLITGYDEVAAHELLVFDLSDNHQLRPSCLSQAFTSSDDILTCFNQRH
ncbi:hephaestin-like protein [Clavelina lepadiformis]|uniref:hephaestin-like protein n=1 Tax=Clavelina lepadiformis TaxID=159417 RepID=UPI0040424869